MNKRQQKKRLKRALDILNEIEAIDSDYESEGVLYINIENDSFSRSVLEEFCGLLGIDKKKFIKACNEDADDEDILDLVNVWWFIKEPKGYATYHSSIDGFLLKWYKERDE